MSTPALISAAQIQLYAEFDGDVDTYQRRGMPQREVLGDNLNAWDVIEDLRRRLHLVAAGLASTQFAEATEADLLAWVPKEEPRRILPGMPARNLPLKAYHYSSSNPTEP